jgi:hypothetical protein
LRLLMRAISMLPNHAELAPTLSFRRPGGGSRGG